MTQKIISQYNNSYLEDSKQQKCSQKCNQNIKEHRNM